MIFVTVGEQLPFDRLISAIDTWAADSGAEVLAQIGNTQLRPNSIKYKKHLNPVEFKNAIMAAEVIVAHAGMGTIITALELEKPLLVMPRQASLGEHRNDHQFATAKRFLEQGYIDVAFDVPTLIKKLGDYKKIGKNMREIKTSCNLIRVLRDFVKNIKRNQK